MTVLRFLLGLCIDMDLAGAAALLVGAIVLGLRRKRLRCRTALLCLAPMAVIHGTPLGPWLLLRLEERFPPAQQPPRGLPDDLAGLILLGGSFAVEDSAARGAPVYNLTAARLFEFIEFARSREQLRVVFTGNAIEARLAGEVFERHGIEAGRTTIEGGSANTRDNALRTFDLVRPQAGERWGLVTSAFHMPRAVGLFRGAGWNVVACPVNYLTAGRIEASAWLRGLGGANAIAWRVAAHEWAGLAWHYFTGESPAFFPGS